MLMSENENVFEKCQWLTFPGVDANLTRTVFQAEHIRKAVLEITALGYFEAYINGKRISDDVFVPAMSEYEKRDLSTIHMPILDEFSYSIYSLSYDVTKLIADGKNVLAAHIGAGWYGQHKSRNEGMSKWGDNLLVFRLTLTKQNGETETICSAADNTKWKQSFILESSLYFGEYQNAACYENGWNTPTFNDDDWLVPAVREAPDSVIRHTDHPTDKVIRTIDPTVIYSFGDTTIYDLHETVSGYAVLQFTEEAQTNDTAVIRYADALNEDGSLQFHYCGGTSRMQRDRFLYDEDKELKDYYPHFTWHAARYFEVTGKAQPVRFDVIHTDIKQVSSFTSDNETLNWLFDAYVRTQLDNIHGCIPSDCPHRERLGYTGDGQLTCGAVMSVFDAKEMYPKWLRDIRDSQDKKGGHVQHTAPFYGGGGGPGGWGGAACIVPYRYYEFYGDKSILKESYDSMKAYIGYMLRHTENGIVTSEEPGGWCLGDWCPPHNDVRIPEAFVNTYFLAKCADITAKTALLLGFAGEATFYAEEAKKARQAIIGKYFDSASGSFCEGTQGADAFAVDLGIGDERTFNNLKTKYSALGTLDTGIFGTDLLIRVLFAKNEGALAFRLLTNEEEASFYNMKKHGATTLWENWDGCDSRCHPMFGAVIEYFFSGILGIRQTSDSVGFRKITVCPADIPQLKEVHGTFGTVSGPITVDITTDADGNRKVSVTKPDRIQLK